MLPIKLPSLVPRLTPTVVVVGDGVSVVMVGDMIRIDVTSDDGTERVTRFVTIVEAQQLNVALTRLSK